MSWQDNGEGDEGKSLAFKINLNFYKCFIEIESYGKIASPHV